MLCVKLLFLIVCVTVVCANEENEETTTSVENEREMRQFNQEVH